MIIMRDGDTTKKLKAGIIVLVVILITIIVGSRSCDSEPASENATPLFDYDESTEEASDYEETSAHSGDIVEVPFEYDNNGLKVVKVKINNTLTIDMIIDSGCTSTLISLAEADYLWKKGVLTKYDFIGNTKSRLANGKIVNNMMFNLKEIVIGDKLVAHNVEVCVSDNVNSGLLLGNEVLDRAASYTVDTEAKVIKFQLK